MKRYYILSIAIAAAMTASAEFPDIKLGSTIEIGTSLTAVPDTVMSIKNANRVTITENPTGVRVTVEGNENDPDFRATYDAEYAPNTVIKSHQEFEMPFFLRKANSNNDLTMFRGLHFGFCGTLGAPASLDVAMEKSFEIGIDELIAYEFSLPGNHNHFSLGMGINWRNYRMTGDTRFIPADGCSVEVGQWPEDVEPRYSRLKMFSLGFPVMYRHDFPVKMLGHAKLSVKLGAILNWNSHASLLTTWREADGTDARQKSDHIGHRKFTVDFMAAVKIAPASGLYVKYSPMKFFRADRGPEFSTISTGIYLLF